MFYITPGSKRKHTLNNEDIVKIHINKDKSLTFSGNPSKEMMMHCKILSQCSYNKEAYVVHCHPQNVLSFIGTQNNRELREIVYMFPELEINIGENVRYITSGTNQLALETSENIHKKDIVALANHGVVCVNENLQSAIDTIEVLDYYCEIALKSE